MQQTTGQLKLSKIDLTDVPDITILNPNFDKLDTEITKLKNDKVDKVSGKSLSTNDYTNEEKTKLTSVAQNANNYTHPSSHPPSIITQDTNNRLVSDVEKSTWNSKASTTPATTSVSGLMSKEDKTKLDGVATNAQVNQNAFSNVKVGSTTLVADNVTDTLEIVAGTNVTIAPDATNDKITISSKDTIYNHPNTHPATIITPDATHRFVTDTEKNNWNGKTDMRMVESFVGTSINNHDIGWNHHDMIGYYSDLVDKKKTIVDALNSHTEKITVLSDDRGYLNTVFLSDNYDFDLVVKNGKYKLWKGVNAPKPTECGWFIDVIAQDDNHLVQYARSFIYGSDILATRQKVSGVWQTWNISATTDKIDTLWEGNASSGMITISLPYTGYNEIVVTLGGGDTVHTSSYNFVNKLFDSGLTAFNFLGLYGITKLIKTSPTTFTLTTVNNQALRKIIGIKRGEL
ncbi:MAG: hypothetical protein RSE41_06810 [Clostridia bacterium]